MTTTTWKILGVTALFIICGVCFGMWRYTALQLNAAEKDLAAAEANIKTLQADKAALVQYTVKKDAELKKIEIEYSERLKNVPMDECGDAKPSKELLDFYKGVKDV